MEKEDKYLLESWGKKYRGKLKSKVEEEKFLEARGWVNNVAKMKIGEE